MVARRRWYADGGIASKLTGVIFFQRIVGPKFMGQPTDEAAVEKAIAEEVPAVFDYLEGLRGRNAP